VKKPDAVTTEFTVERLERKLLMSLIRGEYRAGDYLPSVIRLAQMSGCGKVTVTSAIGRLVSRGLLSLDAGKGIRVEELLETCDVELLLMMIGDKSDAERALELEAQLLDLMSVFFLEVGFRAAAMRGEDHVKWFNHYVRELLDRVNLEAHVAYVASTAFQLMRVIAAAGGSVAFTILLNAFRSYLNSGAGLELFPPEVWQQFGDALEKRDVTRAREILQRAFDRRSSRVLELLAKIRGSGDGGPGGPVTVELMEWEPDPSKK
jgi:DNA-binding FadR family transcriptional regulator